MPHDLWIFLRGFLLGIVLAAPLGPTGLLCVRRAVGHGMAIGLATGFGAAIIDSAFAGLAAFGVTAALSFIVTHTGQLQLAGSLVLFVMAWITWHGKVPGDADIKVTIDARSLLAAASSGFLLTLTNPVTISAILAVTATFGGALTRPGATILTLGVFCGSVVWWCILSGVSALMRQRFSEKILHRINRGIAIALTIIACIILGRVLYIGLPAILSGKCIDNLIRRLSFLDIR